MRPCLSVWKLKRNERKLKRNENHRIGMDILWKSFQILTFFAVHLQRHLQVLCLLILHFPMNPSRGAELLHPPRVEQGSRIPAGSALPPWGFRQVEGSFARTSRETQNNSHNSAELHLCELFQSLGKARNDPSCRVRLLPGKSHRKPRIFSLTP